MGSCCSCLSCCDDKLNDIQQPIHDDAVDPYHSNTDREPCQNQRGSQSVSQRLEHEAPFSFTPRVIVKNTRNGVIALQITNSFQIVSAPEPIYKNWSNWHFEFAYQCVRDGREDEWKSIKFSPDTITQTGMFYVKIKLHISDYQMNFRVRAKHSSHDTYFAYCDALNVNISSSLIDSTFDIGEYINFLDETSMYTKEGFVSKILDEGFIEIKCKNNDGKLIKLHQSRVYAAPIYLGFVLDLTDPLEIDKNLLLRSKCNEDANDDKEDDDVSMTYHALTQALKQYASAYAEQLLQQNQNLIANFDASRECDLFFMARFVSLNVMEFLYTPYYKEPKIGCLVNEADGWITSKSYIHHCLNRHQQGIESHTDDVMNANLQELWSYCDICSLEISRLDWITSCNVDIVDSHVMCLSCVYNKIEQKEQLYQLLHELLSEHLYNDCIEQLVAFVCGRVVAHEAIL